MTNDEILSAMDQHASSFEDLRKVLEKKLVGKTCAYGNNKSFQITSVSAAVQTNRGGYAYVWVRGPLYKKDGTLHRNNQGSCRIENIKIIDTK